MEENFISGDRQEGVQGRRNSKKRTKRFQILTVWEIPSIYGS